MLIIAYIMFTCLVLAALLMLLYSGTRGYQFPLWVALFIATLPLFTVVHESRAVSSDIALTMHIAFYLIGIVAFYLAFLISFLVVLENYLIKRKRSLRVMQYLPPLVTLDRAILHLNLMGLPCITVALSIGFLLAHRHWQADWGADPKIWLALACSLWYTALLVGRFFLGWRGYRLAILNFAGFGVILMLVLLEQFFRHSLHRSLWT